MDSRSQFRFNNPITTCTTFYLFAHWKQFRQSVICSIILMLLSQTPLLKTYLQALCIPLPANTRPCTVWVYERVMPLRNC